MVKLKMHLSFVEKAGSEEFEVIPGVNYGLLDFLDTHGIKSDEVGMVIADGRWKNPAEVVLDEYSTIEVFPHLEGG